MNPRFYDEHVDKVYKFFYIKCLDRTTAEDLTSDTFMAFIEQASLHHVTDEKKYLYGIMRNTWLHFLRDKYQQALTDVENIEDFASHVDDSVASYDVADSVQNRLYPYIERLPARQREVLILRIIDNKSVKEIALELGKDRNYVKTTYRRAIVSLRGMLSHPYMEGAV